MATHANSRPVPPRSLLQLVPAAERTCSKAQHAPSDAEALPTIDRLSRGEDSGRNGANFSPLEQREAGLFSAAEPDREAGLDQRDAASRRGELLAILDAGPLPHAFMTRQQRQAIQNGIDALIDYLDAVDTDPDLEDDGCAEYYMGWSENGPRAHFIPSMFGVDECEPDACDEPCLVSPETVLTFSSFVYGPPAMFDQTWWGSSGMYDREQVNEDGGDILDEPHDALEDCYA